MFLLSHGTICGIIKYIAVNITNADAIKEHIHQNALKSLGLLECLCFIYCGHRTYYTLVHMSLKEAKADGNSSLRA